MNFDLFIPSWLIHGFLWSLYAFATVSLLLLATAGANLLIHRARSYTLLVRAARGLHKHKDLFHWWQQGVRAAEASARLSDQNADVAWDQHRVAREKYEALAKIAVEFMARVEAGEVRSVRTYNAFKEALGADRQLFGFEVLRYPQDGRA